MQGGHGSSQISGPIALEVVFWPIVITKWNAEEAFGLHSARFLAKDFN
jgi:hypothetical protein